MRVPWSSDCQNTAKPTGAQGLTWRTALFVHGLQTAPLRQFTQMCMLGSMLSIPQLLLLPSLMTTLYQFCF